MLIISSVSLTRHSNIPTATFFNYIFCLTHQQTTKNCVCLVTRYLAFVFVQAIALIWVWKANSLAKKIVPTIKKASKQLYLHMCMKFIKDIAHPFFHFNKIRKMKTVFRP